MKLQYSVAQLFFASLFVLIAVWITCVIERSREEDRVSYVYSFATGDLSGLTAFHEDFESDSLLDVKLINHWLINPEAALPDSYPVVRHPGTDPWGNPYQCKSSPVTSTGVAVPYGHLMHPSRGFVAWRMNGEQVGGEQVAGEQVACFGFFSLGEDGISISGGNDPDDLNSWDVGSFAYYKDGIAKARFIRHRRQFLQTFAAVASILLMLVMMGSRIWRWASTDPTVHDA